MSTLVRTMLVDSLDATAQDAFDKARRSIDALGGSCKPGDRYAEGYNDAIGHALDIMDALGAMDQYERKRLRDMVQARRGAKESIA